jgi:hypothetical protein
LVVLWVILAASTAVWSQNLRAGRLVAGIALLVPDSARLDEPEVTIWTDAALEEGVQLTPVHDSEFLAGRAAYAALIVPDEVHKEASARLVDAVERYVAAGGNLMLVFDAGTLDERRLYPLGKSRFSKLAGVDYAFYTTLRNNTVQRAVILGTARSMDELQVPPGKTVPFTGSTVGVAPDLPPATTPYYTISTYTYGELPYSSFVTRGPYDGEVLLRSIPGLVAGYRRSGQGKVLFVNLPLGYLARRTDGLLLHGFLHYFAARAGLPSLAAVPDAAGGLVLNWHLDSNAAEAAIPEIENLGFFRQGPYSIHITAGPDRDTAGDHLGLDIPENQRMQRWIRTALQQGNTIGDHGGWIHNYFGYHLNENDPSFARYLELNTEALEKVTGSPIVEYSAPVGNHPKWVTNWLAAHGFLAYYFTGNTGMAPTRSYRDGVRSDRTIWSFPITNLGNAASLEDMHQAGLPESAVADWLSGMAEFVARQRVSRLVYAHPPGAQFYPVALRSWLQKTAELRSQGSFRWYTMTALAQFLDTREQVQWQTEARPDGSWVVTASHPQTLAHQAWFLPKQAFERPSVLQGSATIQQDKSRWIVLAGPGRKLSFTAKSRAFALENAQKHAASAPVARKAP